MTFDKLKYDQKYAKDHFKRVPLDMPIEEYEKMKAHMEKLGIKKTNTYLRELISKDIEQSKNITTGDINQQGNNNTINIG